MKTGMKTAAAITLIIVGGVLIAAPIVALVIDSSTYQSNLLKYFQEHGNAASTTRLSEARADAAYFWLCGLVGLGLVAIGIRATWDRTRSSATQSCDRSNENLNAGL